RLNEPANSADGSRRRRSFLVNADVWFTLLGTVVVAAPAVLLLVLGSLLLAERTPSESAIGRLTQIAVLTGLAAALAILAWMLGRGTRLVTVQWGDWVSLPSEHFHFAVAFVFDRLSIPFVILSYVLCGIVG